MSASSNLCDAVGRVAYGDGYMAAAGRSKVEANKHLSVSHVSGAVAKVANAILGEPAQARQTGPIYDLKGFVEIDVGYRFTSRFDGSGRFHRGLAEIIELTRNHWEIRPLYYNDFDLRAL